MVIGLKPNGHCRRGAARVYPSHVGKSGQEEDMPGNEAEHAPAVARQDLVTPPSEEGVKEWFQDLYRDDGSEG